jgi:hypothetical protein
MLARLGEGPHVHGIRHIDPRRNTGSDDSIEDLAFEQKESWHLEHL